MKKRLLHGSRAVGIALLVVGLVVLVAAFALPVTSVRADPSTDPGGSNGTVKIDGWAFDHGGGRNPDDPDPDNPDNEPHVGCEFSVQWYNFDEGDLYSSILFEVWPGTGGKQDVTPTVVSARDPAGTATAFGPDGRVFIGEDDASGADAEGLDARVTYNLIPAIQALTPPVSMHEKHGYHVKVTITADGVKKDGEVFENDFKKHKVFWTTPCAPEPTTTPPTSTPPTTTPPTTTPPTTTPPTSIVEENPPVVVLPEVITTTSTSTTTTTTAPPTTTTVGVAVLGEQLARTGTMTPVLLLLAGLALVSGGALLAFGKEREAS